MRGLSRIIIYMGACLLLSLTVGCAKQEEGASQEIELTVSAAASLQSALKDIEKQYEAKHTNVNILFNFGSSGALQQQIEQGAPVDLFFSAAEDKFQTLVEKGFVEAGVNVLGNKLALIVPKKDTTTTAFIDLKSNKVKQVALGAPESVPAGKYGKQMLISLNLWNDIQTKMIDAKDVRQVLTYVETQNVQAGIVYYTDALSSDKVRIVEFAPSGTHDPITYPLGIVKDTKHREETQELYQYLQQEESQQVFKRYGFTILK